MAQVFERTDDLIGGPASETVRFSVDGNEYSIDLNEKNALDFREFLSGYTAVATYCPPEYDFKKVREWAQGQGLEVSPRGRIATNVLTAYSVAHTPRIPAPGTNDSQG